MTGTRFSTGARPRHAWTADLFGLLWVLAAAGAVLAPAFSHGPYLGSFDWVSRFGLSQNPAVVVHNRQTFDQIAEFIPWTKLAWTQVHHGHLPLWNPSSVLGMPLAFTWQAGTFSIPVVLGYLFPVSLSYTVQVVATLVIAGTGVYVLGRVMGLSVLACTMAATVYELSGAFFGWLGWPIASVMSWIGWLCAAAILVVRGGRRARAVAFLALIVACAIYAGQPDTLVLLGTAFLVFMVALLGSRTAPLRGSGPIRRPVLDTVLGVAAGAALGSPLLLPGMQLISGSVRSGKNLSQAVSAQSIMLTLFQGFDGLPVTGSRFFGSGYYTKSVAYVGVIAVVLAVLAVVAAVKLRQRRSEVIGFGAVAVAMAAIVYLPIVESALDGLPLIGSVLWRRATIPLMFGPTGVTPSVAGWRSSSGRPPWCCWPCGPLTAAICGRWRHPSAPGASSGPSPSPPSDWPSQRASRSGHDDTGPGPSTGAGPRPGGGPRRCSSWVRPCSSSPPVPRCGHRNPPI
jgi:hypothetical protein